MIDDHQPNKLDEIYPLGEKQPDRVQTRNGHRLRDLTLDNLLAGGVTASDFGITADGLRLQATIAEQAGRPSLAQNLRRGAEQRDGICGQRPWRCAWRRWRAGRRTL